MLCGAAAADIHSSGEWVMGIWMGICIIESPVIHYCSVAKLYCFFVNPWTAVYQASLSFTMSQSLLRLMSAELMMPYSHLILCRPLLLLPSVFPSIRVFSNELALRIWWPNYWSLSFSISPSNEYSRLISLRID